MAGLLLPHCVFSLPGSKAGFRLTLGKVYFFAALGANMLSIEFVGEDFFFLSTTRALADKRLQVFKLLKTGAVLRRVHF
jgi:hypothetical protein